MKKATKVLAIIATVILLLSALGTFSLFLLDIILEWSDGASLYRILRTVPVSDMTSTGLTLLIGVLICFTAGSKKVGLWSDIVLPAAGLSVVPAIANYTNYIYAQIVTVVADDYFYHVTYFSSENELIQISYSINQIFVAVAFGLLLVACGMSIAYKHLTCKQEKELCADSEEQIFPDAV